MNHRYSHILTPVRVGDLVLKNRLINSKSIPEGWQGQDPASYMTEQTISFAANIARNGASVVTCSPGMFRQFKGTEIKRLSGALGNLLPLSQSVNSALQNDSFEDKKHSKNTGRRGYENGSHSEIEVSKLQDWTAFEIYSRTEKLLVFMQERWNL